MIEENVLIAANQQKLVRPLFSKWNSRAVWERALFSWERTNVCVIMYRRLFTNMNVGVFRRVFCIIAVLHAV